MSLSDIQANIRAPKSQYNKFGGFHYRSAEDILTAVKPLIQADGGKLELSDEPVMVGDWHYVRATVTYIDSNGNKDTTYGYAREPEAKRGMDPSQITGTASSYARKYALNGLFAIDDAKDADTDEYQRQNNAQPKRQQRSNNNQSKPNQPANQQSIATTPIKDTKLNAEINQAKTEYKTKLGKLAQASGISAKQLNSVAISKAQGSVKNYDNLGPLDKSKLLISSIDVMQKEFENGGNN